jgi:hypothetical protein
MTDFKYCDTHKCKKENSADVVHLETRTSNKQTQRKNAKRLLGKFKELPKYY